MAQPMTTAAGSDKANWMRLSIRTSDCSGLSLAEDFAGGEGRSGWSGGIGIGASYTPRVALVGAGRSGRAVDEEQKAAENSERRARL